MCDVSVEVPPNPEDRGDLRAFFHDVYPRLVRSVAIAAGSVEDAEELVQEAFVRLVSRWEKVRRYEDPEAWVRSVAFRQLSNRRRKLRNGLRAVRLLGSVPPPAPQDHEVIDVYRALRTLPLPQRQVVVLHYLLGLDVASIAAELRIAPGTVKSRLSRGRAGLRPLLSEESHA